MTPPIAPVRFAGDRLVLLDQTALPVHEVEREYTRWEDVAEAIRSLVVRGAPAIGVAAAFAVVLAAQSSRATTTDALIADLEPALKGLAACRIAWHPEGRYLAGKSGVWDTETGKRLGPLVGASGQELKFGSVNLLGMAFSPDGALVAGA